ncbi:exodeoxyribonuclease VII small subunit [Coxiella-like endosymbiont of Rhipicephalus sanguineus]|uniref:exodeoxyribonuclease VII small subunit n=1 Tax=Coxiella-like endosymbiont of Rhipicephalus sanguineus TaxID=1955402 RepID=UPI00203FF78B|nr:exodeoxyribonuclease VII small subunit [Coxiella-like endosymbiont of Rhipicephalus sanguineus]
MPQKKEKEFNFEKALDQLTELVEIMEQGSLPLEESLKKFEIGVNLIRNCQLVLTEAEQKSQTPNFSARKGRISPILN